MKTNFDKEAPRAARGFTLIELMIVVVIIGILGAIAYPSYLDSARKARRSDAKSAMETLAGALERARIRNNGSYAGATINGLYGGNTSAEGHYTLAFGDSDGDGDLTDEPNPASYLLIATPTGAQAKDGRCASFTLNQANVRAATDANGNATTIDCW